MHLPHMLYIRFPVYYVKFMFWNLAMIYVVGSDSTQVCRAVSHLLSAVKRLINEEWLGVWVFVRILLIFPVCCMNVVNIKKFSFMNTQHLCPCVIPNKLFISSDDITWQSTLWPDASSQLSIFCHVLSYVFQPHPTPTRLISMNLCYYLKFTILTLFSLYSDNGFQYSMSIWNTK